MKANTDHLVRELNKSFGPPFLPEGFFKAAPGGEGLKLRIGDRDLDLDGKGKVRSAGTAVGLGKKWKIERL